MSREAILETYSKAATEKDTALCCPVDYQQEFSPEELQHIPAEVLVQTARGIGDNGIWRIAKLNGILYLLDVGSKTTSFSSAFAGIFASN